MLAPFKVWHGWWIVPIKVAQMIIRYLYYFSNLTLEQHAKQGRVFCFWDGQSERVWRTSCHFSEQESYNSRLHEIVWARDAIYDERARTVVVLWYCSWRAKQSDTSLKDTTEKLAKEKEREIDNKLRLFPQLTRLTTTTTTGYDCIEAQKHVIKVALLQLTN